MATANFHNVNASRIYAVELEEAEDYIELKSGLLFEFRQLDNFYTEVEKEYSTPYDELRGYPSEIICELTDSKELQNGMYYSNFQIVIRQGYYSGCNLDYSFDSFSEGEVKENNFEKWALKSKEKIGKEIEKVFAKYSIPLKCIGTASNGEAFYEKA